VRNEPTPYRLHHRQEVRRSRVADAENVALLFARCGIFILLAIETA
jgi:hypothetical protein